MPGPKLTRILDTIAARAAAITVAGGFYSDIGARVLRDRREPPVHELPAVAVLLGARSAEVVNASAARASLSVDVIGYRTYTDEADIEALGVELLADIQRALELDDTSLGGLVIAAPPGYGFAWQSDEVYLPDPGENVIAARVTYAVPHIRKSGDPEIS